MRREMKINYVWLDDAAYVSCAFARAVFILLEQSEDRSVSVEQLMQPKPGLARFDWVQLTSICTNSYHFELVYVKSAQVSSRFHSSIYFESTWTNRICISLAWGYNTHAPTFTEHSTLAKGRLMYPSYISLVVHHQPDYTFPFSSPFAITGKPNSLGWTCVNLIYTKYIKFFRWLNRCNIFLVKRFLNYFRKNLRT